MAILSSPLQLISSTPVTTRSFTAATLGFSLLYYLLRWHDSKPYSTPYLTLIPGESIFYPWTLVTAGLVEVTGLELILTLVFVPVSLRYFERLWGSLETLKFILVTTAVPNFMSFVVNWVEYLVFRNADLFLYGLEYHGTMALQTGILVAFTQLIPEHQVQVFGLLKVRVKRLPMAYVTLSTVMVFAGFQSPWINIQWGWLVSWVYLRFYKKNKGDAIASDSYGDRSETFAFVSWFPPFIHTPITLLGNFVHPLATRFHLIPGSGSDVESGYTQLPGGPRAEAERRRALALKALDQRVASSVAPPKDTFQPTELGSPASPVSPGTPASEMGRGDHHDRHKSAGEVDLGIADLEGKGKEMTQAYSLFCLGNPLLDMQVTDGEQLLKKYKLNENDAILAGDDHAAIYDDLVQNYKLTYVAGGASQNAARGAAYILPPNSVVYTGCVGDDVLAEQLKAANKREGLTDAYLVKKGEKTGACAVIITGHHRSLVTTLQAAEKFELSHLKSSEIKPLVDGANFFYVEGFFLTHGVESVVFVLNLSAPFIPQFFKAQVDQVLPFCDIVIGNESEAEAWADASGQPDKKDLPAVARALALTPKSNPSRPRTVIFTQGPESTIVVSAADNAEERIHPVQALKSEEIVDTNGAGDAFAGGVLGALVDGRSIDEAVDIGHKMGAMCVQQVGPQFKWPKVQIL
ncbi:hypothetical protein EW145_g529 [Phellinidium pouzarii]|uniref:adenosine kinase n=1 Tax=Phellinidium pouzarii TaxID=167371 RepID=A0A4S4LIJ7_9AGAM|nr:hypothetical protein EW145_g529 [Phellinidium pouzarii]